MRKPFLAIPLFLSMLLLSAVSARPASALETRMATEKDGKVVVPAETTIADDFVVAGQTVDIRGVIEGDLYVFAETITITGAVHGDVYAAAKIVDISGAVRDDLFAAGAEVKISGTVGDNATVAGSTLAFSDASTVGRDLTVAGEQLTANGRVGRFLTLATSTATIDGTILGIRGQVDQLTLGSKAYVYGDVEITGSKEPTYASGAAVVGKKTFHQELVKDAKDGDQIRVILGRIGSWLFGFLGAVLAGSFVLLAMPSLAHSAARALSDRPFVSFGVGILVLFALPLLFFVLLFTMVGIKLAFLVTTLAAFFILASSAPVGLWMGHMILSRRRAGAPPLHDLWAMSLGLFIIALLAAIPFVGPVVTFIAAIAGLGSFLLSGRHPVTPTSTPTPVSPVPLSHV